MDREIQQRLHWVELYSQCKDAGLACRRCGISRPTLRKWWRRYQEAGLAGLQSLSQRPHHPPATKAGDVEEALIPDLRRLRNLGARRIQSELLRQNNLSLGLTAIHKILQRNHVAPVVRYRRKKTIFVTKGPRLVIECRWIRARLLQA